MGKLCLTLIALCAALLVLRHGEASVAHWENPILCPSNRRHTIFDDYRRCPRQPPYYPRRRTTRSPSTTRKRTTTTTRPPSPPSTTAAPPRSTSPFTTVLKPTVQITVASPKYSSSGDDPFKSATHPAERRLGLLLSTDLPKSLDSTSLEGLPSQTILPHDAPQVSWLERFLPLHINDRILSLTFNDIHEIPSSAFSNFKRLQVLDLSLNRIHYIADGAFQGLESLRRLRLGFNDIKRISRKMFTSADSPTLPKLAVLDLEVNLLETLPKDLLLAFPNLVKINLVGNPWHCDRKLAFSINAITKSPQGVLLSHGRSALCATPPKLRNVFLGDLTIHLSGESNTEADSFTTLTTTTAGSHTPPPTPGTVMKAGESKVPSSSDHSDKWWVILGVTAGVLGVALTVIIAVVVVRKVRRWKRGTTGGTSGSWDKVHRP